ncbi:MAG TPA: PAS domain-containing protein [Candidatus Sulfotelmatobacter sp.]|nr:PAS domain-containing protein [Candidatus Sulfotelmatobacter sp.]
MADSFKETTANPAAAVKDAVRASELRSQAVLEVLPIGLAILDSQSRLIYSNRRYTELRGIPSDLAAWVKAIHPEDRERVFNSRTKALARGEPWADTYRFVHANGMTIWVSARAVPLRAGSELVGFVLTLEDVTP